MGQGCQPRGRPAQASPVLEGPGRVGSHWTDPRRPLCDIQCGCCLRPGQNQGCPVLRAGPTAELGSVPWPTLPSVDTWLAH